MNAKNARKLAQSIIDSNIYLTLGTTNGRNSWVSPLFYCKDEKNRFYVISQPGSRHVRYLTHNPQISFAIFDSHAPEGKGNGIQATGVMRECEGITLTRALAHYHTDFIPCTKDAFTQGAYRLYRITPSTMYILDPEAKVDKRLKVTF